MQPRDKHNPLPETALTRLVARAKELRGVLDNYTQTPEYEEECVLANVAIVLSGGLPESADQDAALTKVLSAEDPDVTLRQLARLVYPYGVRLRVSLEKIPDLENT